ncbi:MAG: hypothetical protein WBC60_17410 [Cognaticolwellia sp.]
MLASIPLAISGLKKVNIYDSCYILVAIFSCLIFLAMLSEGVNFRGPLQYVGFLMLYFAFKNIYNRAPDLIVHFIKLLVMSYFIAALLQVLFGGDVLSNFLSVRTTDNRGFTSLTPEPALYGLMLLCAGVIIYVSDIHNKFKLYLLILFQIIFFSQSALAILLSLITLMLWLLLNRLRTFLIVMSIFTISIISFVGLLSQKSRIGYLINKVVDSPLSILSVDASINERVSHIVLPIYGAINNFFFPSGFSSFSEVLMHKGNILGGLFWWGSPTNVIMSGFSAAIFELGIMGLVFIAASICLIWSFSFRGNKDKIFLSACIMLVMFQAIPITNPLFPWLLCASRFKKFGY